MDKFHFKENHVTWAAEYVNRMLKVGKKQGHIERDLTRKGAFIMFYLGYYGQSPDPIKSVSGDDACRIYMNAVRKMERKLKK